MRSTTLPMDAFGKDAIVEYAQTRGVSLSDAIRDAARFYLGDRDSGRPAWRLPRFARARDRGPAAELEIELDDETWDALDREARRQGVPTLVLLQHAVLYFLASAS
jgi:hypothetical protein